MPELGDVTEETRAFLDELQEGSNGATRTPTRLEEIGALSYEQMLEDRALLDRTARAICLNLDCDYIEAFELLDEWCETASSAQGVSKGEVTLWDVLGDESAGPARFDVVCRDVLLMEAEDAGAKAKAALRVITLDSTDAKVGEIELTAEDVDAAGQVKLPDGADRAFLLTDAYTLERAWLTAKELGYEDREKFKADYRAQVEAGLDFTATLEWRNGAAASQAAAEQARLLDRQTDRERAERKRRAEQRQLDAR